MTGPAPSAQELLHAGLARANAGDVAGASALLDRAVALEPRNAAVLTGRAIIYRVEGRLRDAVLTCDAAIRLQPDLAGAWLERGIVLASGGSPVLAKESFARAARLAPQHAEAHANVAALAARQGALEEARAAAQQALTLEPGNILAAVAMGTVLLADDAARQAVELLAPLVGTAALGDSRMQAHTLLGRAHERLGDHASAFAAFTAANADFAAYTASIRDGRMSNRAFIDAIREGFTAADAKPWSALAGAGEGRPNHLFLLGYPRSGTTLVENVLASIPGVAALEERPTLGETDRAFLLGDAPAIAQNMARFATLGTAELAALRDAYWDHVFAAGIPRDIGHFVDMDPFKGSRLPFIARLFPGAKVVVMRRDPRDVVWSCFRTGFAVSSATLEYTSLESTARHYDALMRLTQSAIERLALEVHELRYETLVADFEPTTRALCAFAGLPWSDAVHGFATTADQRGVATASAGQVRKGLYDGSRQWEPYARWFEPVMPILAPWIERFGYR